MVDGRQTSRGHSRLLAMQRMCTIKPTEIEKPFLALAIRLDTMLYKTYNGKRTLRSQILSGGPSRQAISYMSDVSYVKELLAFDDSISMRHRGITRLACLTVPL